MIQRFNLYGLPEVWENNIIGDPDGRWVTWESVRAYVEYCYQQGLSFEPVVVEPVDHTYTDDELQRYMGSLEEFDDLETDVQLDVAEYMERYSEGKDDSL